MKKLVVVMTVLVTVLYLAACNGEEKASEETSKPVVETSTETEETSSQTKEQVTELKFVTKEFGNISINVPNTFSGEVEEDEGIYTLSGPNAGISVSSGIAVDFPPSEWNENILAEAIGDLYSDIYSQIELGAFEGNVNMNGNEAVYYAFYGTDEGQEYFVHCVLLYNEDLTAQYAISFTHLAEDESYDADLSLQIINSITLSPDAQHVVGQ